MSVTLTIRDETASGQVYHEMPLQFPSERVTVRELIRERVYQEVQDFNRKRDEKVFRGLVQPTDAECVLNGKRTEYHLKKHREIDWKQQFENALDAFRRNGFLVLVDDKQAESLDQEFVVGHDTDVSFVKLTLLAGG
ncbi:MAG: hypothetical protein JXM70_28010 [Pirellulales bacterium]|nr:hypothetical protein [Pirellulales bacterium]